MIEADDVKVDPVKNQRKNGRGELRNLKLITGGKIIGAIIKTSEDGDDRIEFNGKTYPNALALYESADLRVLLGTGQLTFLGPGSVGGGQIASLGSNSILITGGEQGVFLSSGVGAFYPENNNELNLGDSSFRWSTVYSVNADNISSYGRFKKKIKTIKNGHEKILALRPVSFVRKVEKQVRFGFIAQEVEKVIPEIVSKGEDGVRGIAHTELIPFLVDSIQQLTKRVAELEKIKRK